MSKDYELVKVCCLILVIITQIGCSNDLEINLHGNTIPVVHFVLDPFEDEYYALITKTGLVDANILLALDSSELFYTSPVDLSLELWNDSVRLWYSEFTPVEAVKNPGLFPEGEGYLYKANQVIPQKESSSGFPDEYPDFVFFRIIINGSDFSETAYSKIKFGEYPEIIQPHFADQKVRFYSLTPLIIAWNSTSTVRYFDLNFRFHYEEVYLDGREQDKTVEFNYSKDVQTSSGSYQVIIDSDLFLAKLAKCFPNTLDSVDYRKFDAFDVVIVGGDKNFEEYLAHGRLSAEPTSQSWSNITNGLGIFALKYVVSKKSFRFHQQSKDSLADGKYTRGLGFVRW